MLALLRIVGLLDLALATKSPLARRRITEKLRAEVARQNRIVGQINLIEGRKQGGVSRRAYQNAEGRVIDRLVGAVGWDDGEPASQVAREVFVLVGDAQRGDPDAAAQLRHVLAGKVQRCQEPLSYRGKALPALSWVLWQA